MSLRSRTTAIRAGMAILVLTGTLVGSAIVRGQNGRPENPPNPTASMSAVDTSHDCPPAPGHSDIGQKDEAAESYYAGPGYTGWTQHKDGKVRGAFRSPHLFGGKTVYWEY